MKYIAGTRGSHKDIKAGDKNRKNYPIQIKLLQETDRIILYVLLQRSQTTCGTWYYLPVFGLSTHSISYLFLIFPHATFPIFLMLLWS